MGQGESTQRSDVGCVQPPFGHSGPARCKNFCKDTLNSDELSFEGNGAVVEVAPFAIVKDLPSASEPFSWKSASPDIEEPGKNSCGAVIDETSKEATDPAARQDVRDAGAYGASFLLQGAWSPRTIDWKTYSGECCGRGGMRKDMASARPIPFRRAPSRSPTPTPRQSPRDSTAADSSCPSSSLPTPRGIALPTPRGIAPPASAKLGDLQPVHVDEEGCGPPSVAGDECVMPDVMKPVHVDEEGCGQASPPSVAGDECVVFSDMEHVHVNKETRMQPGDIQPVHADQEARGQPSARYLASASSAATAVESVVEPPVPAAPSSAFSSLATAFGSLLSAEVTRDPTEESLPVLPVEIQQQTATRVTFKIEHIEYRQLQGHDILSRFLQIIDDAVAQVFDTEDEAVHVELSRGAGDSHFSGIDVSATVQKLKVTYINHADVERMAKFLSCELDKLCEKKAVKRATLEINPRTIKYASVEDASDFMLETPGDRDHIGPCREFTSSSDASKAKKNAQRAADAPPSALACLSNLGKQIDEEKNELEAAPGNQRQNKKLYRYLDDVQADLSAVQTLLLDGGEAPRRRSRYGSAATQYMTPERESPVADISSFFSPGTGSRMASPSPSPRARASPSSPRAGGSPRAGAGSMEAKFAESTSMSPWSSSRSPEDFMFVQKVKKGHTAIDPEAWGEHQTETHYRKSRVTEGVQWIQKNMKEEGLKAHAPSKLEMKSPRNGTESSGPSKYYKKRVNDDLKEYVKASARRHNLDSEEVERTPAARDVKPGCHTEIVIKQILKGRETKMREIYSKGTDNAEEYNNFNRINAQCEHLKNAYDVDDYWPEGKTATARAAFDSGQLSRKRR
eukprot:TRINITY_DN8367_c0_g1_i2.p1 TRINITY_DN8367_c0_g1~~TRINITY_DN8367_c0_g1_i2.p1  ORF type:complete len:854 (+),score=141.41 TRINITY_DN8367_c0_g1_i2:138-2699(+)